MRREDALKKLRKLLGPKMLYRVNQGAPDHDERVQAREDLKPALEERRQTEEKMNARRRAILAADEEYQSLKADYEVVKKTCERLSAVTRHYKMEVGTDMGLFFSIKAQGDSWEDVIRKLTPERKTERSEV